MNAKKINGFTRLGLIANQELVASFTSIRGLFVTAVFILIWILLLFYPIRISAEAMVNPDTANWFVGILSLLGLDPLQDWLLSEFAIYWVVALYLFPTFSLLSAADQMISDRNRASLRFLTLRCSRGQLYFGRFIGHMLIQAVLLSITLVITYGLLMLNKPQYWLEGLSLLPLIFCHILLVTAPFIALMSLLSVSVNSVRMASLVAFVILAFGGFVVSYLEGFFPILSVLNYWIPGGQIYAMAQSHPTIAWGDLWSPMMQTFGFLLIGYAVFRGQEI